MLESPARPHALPRSTRHALWASIGSMSFVAIVSATPNSPFLPILPMGWQPSGPIRWVADLLQLYRLENWAIMVLGLVATTTAAVGFLLILREAWNGRLSMKTVVILSIAYSVIAVMLPLLFSRDVYSYGYYGRTVWAYGANPYVQTPADFNLNALAQYVWPGWRGTPSVYGPLFTWISVILTSTAKSVPSMIDGFQVVAAAAALATMGLVARLAGRIRPGRAVFAAAMIGLNPVVVFHVIGGGHNDMLIGLAVAAALTAVFSRRFMLAAVILALGMSIKATAIVPLALLVVYVVAEAKPEMRRRLLATFAAIIGGTWLVLALPFIQATNPTLGLLDVANNNSWMAPGQVLVHLFSEAGRIVGGESFADAGQVIAHLTIYATSAIAVTWIGVLLWKRPEFRTPMGLGAAWGWALLAVVLPAPVLFTWYLMWIIPLTWLLPAVPRRSLAILSGVLIVTQLVTETSRLPGVFKGVELPFGHPIAIAVCVWFGIHLYRRLRNGVPFDAEDEPVFGERYENGPGGPVLIDLTREELELEPAPALTGVVSVVRLR